MEKPTAIEEKEETTNDEELSSDASVSTDHAPSPSGRRLNKKAILWDLTAVSAILAAIVLAVLWSRLSQQAGHDKKQLQEDANKRIATLEKQHLEKLESIKKSNQLYSQSYQSAQQQYQSTQQQLSSDIVDKDTKITQLQREIVKLTQEKTEAEQRWRVPLIETLDVSQDIYAMKWEDNSKVLADMENRSARTVNICQKWDLLCRQLEPYPEFAPQVAKLRIRLAQAYSGLGLVNRIDFDSIDWEISGIARQRPEIEAHVWYRVADEFIRAGKLDEAKKYVERAKEESKKIEDEPDKPGKKDYYVAMTHLLEADLVADTEPLKALESYLVACENLSKIMTSFPKNGSIKAAFVQACIDGATIGESVTNAGKAEKLNKVAYKKILALMNKHPKIKKPKAVFADAKIKEAEELIQEGDQVGAQRALEEARKMVKKSGGNVLLSAAIDSTQAFIYWDHGHRTKALEMIDGAIAKVKKIKNQKSKKQEATYRLASLYWVKSSMRVQPGDAIEDGQTAVTYLVELVQAGAGKREAAARRMIAIIYSDIGHQAYVTQQKKIAKQYFTQARKQWIYLSKTWGENDEYKEGERWCTWRIKSL